MTIKNFAYTIQIDVPPTVIYSHFADPMNYLGLSPLIVEVRQIQHGINAAQKPTCRHEAVELFQLGWIQHRNVITTTTTFEQQDEIFINEVISPMNVRVRFEVHLAPLNDGQATRYQEVVTADAPFMLAGFVEKQAKKMQVIRLARLKERLEQR